MKVRHQTTLTIFSVPLSPDTISDRIGIKPDKTSTRGEKRRSETVTIPRANEWSLIAPDEMPIDEQIDNLLDRIKPYRKALVDLAKDPDVKIGLLIARYFHDQAAKSNRLGIHLSSEALARLAEINATVSVDEYDYSAARRATAKEQNDAIRSWAAKRGISLPGSGRIPPSVREEFIRNAIPLTGASGIGDLKLAAQRSAQVQR